MDIFESLENLNVSEECFNEIMGIVEELLNETDQETIDARNKHMYKLEREHISNGRLRRKFDKKIEKLEKSKGTTKEDLKKAYLTQRTLNNKFHDSLDDIRNFDTSQKRVAAENPDKVVAQLGYDNPAKGIVNTRVLPKEK